MHMHANLVRALAFAGAAAIVGGSIVGLDSYSNAKYQRVYAAATQGHPAAAVRVAIDPATVEVVASRLPRTRTAVHVDESAPRPQS